MKSPVRPHQLILRLATGASILNSGLNKRGADEDTAVSLHGMAVGTYPFLDKIDPATFTRLLSAGEIALGSALLVPLVPNRLAGAGLSAFAAGLLGLYLRTPGMHKPRSLAPTQEGIGLSKDLWLLGAGLALILEECEDHCHKGD
ncbi:MULTISPECIES: membrane protein [Nocardiopsis]|uniref:DoxX family membrane protein n=2 Tax=Nocardiopsis alba TaxID=53437 RepID=A0A7K2IPJ2_9ACTN|nr:MULTISPECIES: membrane protein [Nocardiopsis]AFR06614.1 doxX family protein [Nocardiopsis alba ATCC BAA-2165]MEC3894134.1 hypothetical protein [Nocardiopsis sp. LDBS1602]MYR31747.1 hypothetical protein [Nocardiopsis alba]